MNKINNFEKSIFSKCFYFFSLFLFIYFSYMGIKLKDNIIITIIFFIFVIINILFLYRCFIKYTFTKDEIILNYPFIPKKIYRIDELIGWNYIQSRYGNTFNLFFDKKSIGLEITTKKSFEIINQFIYENYNNVKNKNIKKIKTKGYIIKINKNCSIIFYESYFELINYKKQNKIYSYSDIISLNIENNILLGSVNIIMKDKMKITFLNYYCKGGIGLFEYLNENKNNPNVA